MNKDESQYLSSMMMEKDGSNEKQKEKPEIEEKKVDTKKQREKYMSPLLLSLHKKVEERQKEIEKKIKEEKIQQEKEVEKAKEGNTDYLVNATKEIMDQYPELNNYETSLLSIGQPLSSYAFSEAAIRIFSSLQSAADRHNTPTPALHPHTTQAGSQVGRSPAATIPKPKSINTPKTPIFIGKGTPVKKKTSVIQTPLIKKPSHFITPSSTKHQTHTISPTSPSIPKINEGDDQPFIIPVSDVIKVVQPMKELQARKFTSADDNAQTLVNKLNSALETEKEKKLKKKGKDKKKHLILNTPSSASHPVQSPFILAGINSPTTSLTSPQLATLSYSSWFKPGKNKDVIVAMDEANNNNDGDDDYSKGRERDNDEENNKNKSDNNDNNDDARLYKKLHELVEKNEEESKKMKLRMEDLENKNVVRENDNNNNDNNNNDENNDDNSNDDDDKNDNNDDDNNKNDNNNDDDNNYGDNNKNDNNNKDGDNKFFCNGSLKVGDEGRGAFRCTSGSPTDEKKEEKGDDGNGVDNNDNNNNDNNTNNNSNNNNNDDDSDNNGNNNNNNNDDNIDNNSNNNNNDDNNGNNNNSDNNNNNNNNDNKLLSQNKKTKAFPKPNIKNTTIKQVLKIPSPKNSQLLISTLSKITSGLLSRPPSSPSSSSSHTSSSSSLPSPSSSCSSSPSLSPSLSPLLPSSSSSSPSSSSSSSSSSFLPMSSRKLRQIDIKKRERNFTSPGYDDEKNDNKKNHYSVLQYNDGGKEEDGEEREKEREGGREKEREGGERGKNEENTKEEDEETIKEEESILDLEIQQLDKLVKKHQKRIKEKYNTLLTPKEKLAHKNKYSIRKSASPLNKIMISPFNNLISPSYNEPISPSYRKSISPCYSKDSEHGNAVFSSSSPSSSNLFRSREKSPMGEEKKRERRTSSRDSQSSCSSSSFRFLSPIIAIHASQSPPGSSSFKVPFSPAPVNQFSQMCERRKNGREKNEKRRKEMKNERKKKREEEKKEDEEKKK
jgi:hypothetical protein